MEQENVLAHFANEMMIGESGFYVMGIPGLNQTVKGISVTLDIQHLRLGISNVNVLLTMIVKRCVVIMNCVLCFSYNIMVMRI